MNSNHVYRGQGGVVVVVGGGVFRDSIKRKKEKWLRFRNWAPDVRKCGYLLAPPLSIEDPDQPSTNWVSLAQATTIHGITFVISTSCSQSSLSVLITFKTMPRLLCIWYGNNLPCVMIIANATRREEGVALCQRALLPLCGCRGNCIFCSDTQLRNPGG